jgi:hypothetical protein
MIKSKVVKQQAYSEIKNKNIVLHSIKIYANKTKRDDVFTVNQVLQAKLKRAKTLSEFKRLLDVATEACKIKSKHVKLNLANHSRERQHVRNPVAKLLNLKNFIIEYSKDKTAKKSTAKKSTAKKSTAKKSTAKKSTAKKSTAKK